MQNKIAPHIREIVSQLQKAGYESYIVGGAVRDFLLDRVPKDYDLSSSATPEQIQQVFGRRRAIIIGKRFRLVHLHHGREIIEISTFRQRPQDTGAIPGKSRGAPPEKMIFRDNEFGSAEEDAYRRDFTVNALFHDPVKDEIKDFTGKGLDDIKSGTVRVIGDPLERFEEDPVRILRALKLVGQYNFKLEAATEEALKSSLELITHASLSRLSLELEKILKNPYGDLIFEAFYQHGFLYYFLPYLHKHWESDTGKYMRKLFALRNKHVREELYRDSISLAIATLALPFVERNIGGEHGALWDNYAGIEKIIRQVILKVIAPQNTTKRLMASALRALLLQPRFLNSKSKRIIYHPGYPHGRQLMIMQNELIWQDQELQEFWPERQHKRHLNNPNEAKPKRRRKYPKRKPDRRKPDLGMIEE